LTVSAPFTRFAQASALVLLVFAACSERQVDAPTQPTAVAERALVRATETLTGADGTEARWCPGGLLCEDTKPLLGYRVPWACSSREVRTYVARCSTGYIAWEHIVEFFESRYAVIEHEAAGGMLTITGRRGVVHLGRESTATDAPFAQPATLIVKRHGNGIEFTATRGATDR